MTTAHRFQMAQAVSTAAAASFSVGAAAGAADQRLRVVELASSNMGEAQTQWLRTLQERVLWFDGLELRLSEDYIKQIKAHFAGLATTSSGEGRIRMTNPSSPSFCSVVQFVDPFNERYTCIVLNDNARWMVCSVLILVASVPGTIPLMDVFCHTVRTSLRGLRYAQRIALLLRAKEQAWRAITQTVTEPVVMSACSLTIVAALCAATINASLGLLLAWALARYRFKGKRPLDAAIDVPFALPASVGGLTLMNAYSDQGWMKPICSWLSIRVAFSRLSVLMAMLFVSLPFVVSAVQPVLQSLEQDVEETCWCIGGSSWVTFWHVLLPPLAPALLTGSALGFSRTIGEYGSIVLVASNVPRNDLVVSVLVFQRLEQYDYKGATAIATAALLASFAMLSTINCIQLWLWQQTITR